MQKSELTCECVRGDLELTADCLPKAQTVIVSPKDFEPVADNAGEAKNLPRRFDITIINPTLDT